MALKDDLKSDVNKIFKEKWSVTEKITVPAPTDLGLGNDAGHFKSATVLYADLDGSTNMVDEQTWMFSAEVYKTYLHCAAKIIKAAGGVITAYDGDRIMAVFVKQNPNTSAVRAAFNINYAVQQIINPTLKSVYAFDFKVRHVIGIDTSPIHAARIGVRGDNDIVWVGRAANYAAKLTSLTDFAVRITGTVYDKVHSSVKTSSSGQNLWEERQWTPMNKMRMYRSNWSIPF
jgi:class 3 adenylate cyclase